MKQSIFLLLVLFYGCTITQLSESEKRVPPRPPTPPQMILSEENNELLKHFSDKLLKAEGDLSLHFDSLKLIALDDNAFHRLRFEAIKLISQIPTRTAQIFMLRNIDLYIKNPFELPSFVENYPCFYHLHSANNYHDIFKYLDSSDLLYECATDQKLTFYLRLFDIYGLPDRSILMETLKRRNNNECKMKNLDRMIILDNKK